MAHELTDLPAGSTVEESELAEIEGKFLDSMTATLDRMISHANGFGRRLDLMLAEVK